MDTSTHKLKEAQRIACIARMILAVILAKYSCCFKEWDTAFCNFVKDAEPFTEGTGSSHAHCLSVEEACNHHCKPWSGSESNKDCGTAQPAVQPDRVGPDGLHELNHQRHRDEQRDDRVRSDHALLLAGVVVRFEQGAEKFHTRLIEGQRAVGRISDLLLESPCVVCNQRLCSP